MHFLIFSQLITVQFGLLAAALLIAAFSGCGKKKEQEEVQKAREWELSNFAEGVTPAPKPAPKPVAPMPKTPATRPSTPTVGSSTSPAS